MSKIIYLTNSGSTIVDDIDYDYLTRWDWGNNGSGVTRSTTINGKDITIYMHRIIAARMGLNIEGLNIDHKDRNPYNNQRLNIRTSTRSENSINRNSNKNNTSNYKGVTWNKRLEKWHAKIMKDGKHYHLGYFDNSEEAARAYDLKALELFGQFALTNFPKREYKGLKTHKDTLRKIKNAIGTENWLIHGNLTSEETHVS